MEGTNKTVNRMSSMVWLLRFCTYKRIGELVFVILWLGSLLLCPLKVWSQQEDPLLEEALKEIKKANEFLSQDTIENRKLRVRLDKIETTVKGLEDSFEDYKKNIDSALTSFSLLPVREHQATYIIGCTVDETNSLDNIPNVDVKFFFKVGADSLDSLSDTSGADGRFVTALPIGIDYFVFEARKPGFKPRTDSVTISKSPFLLRIPLSEEFPTRMVSAEIKTRYNWTWEKRVPKTTLTLKWAGKIQGSYYTDTGFIPGVKIPLGNVVVEYSVAQNKGEETGWEPAVSSKIPEDWKILIQHPK
jgi:hypothetical protein